jgi:hypothetical protein
MNYIYNKSNKFIMKITKSIIYQFITFNLMIAINKFLIIFIDIIYILSIWGLITLWILSESFILNSDIKILENNYKELLNRYNLLLNDYNKCIKDKYIQTNLICETIANNNIKIANLDNNINELKKEIIDSPDSIKSNKSTSCIEPLKKEIGKLKETIFSKSCVF